MTASRTDHLSHGARSLQWLLNNLVDEIPGVCSVAVISSDGFLLCSSEAASGATSEAASEAASGLNGELTPSVPRQRPAPLTGGPARSTIDLATIVSGLASLTDGAAQLFDGGSVKQSVVAMENGCLFVMAISDGSLLGVHASPECDMSVVAYHMTLFVGRAGHFLTPELRRELKRARTPSEPIASGH